MIISRAGKIPLRQLVYRVLDLPPSMRPLVYDFGQLNTGAEKDYIAQIVKEHVCCVDTQQACVYRVKTLEIVRLKKRIEDCVPLISFCLLFH